MSRNPPHPARSGGPPRHACEMLLWAVLVFAPAAFGATEWWSRAILECAIFALAGLCALRGDFDPPPTAPLGAFGLIAAIGTVQLAHVRPLSSPAGLVPFVSSRPETACALLLWMALAALYWSASGILRWEGALRRLSWAVFGAGLLVATVGILQRGQGDAAYYGLRRVQWGRPFGPFADCDHAATWLTAAAFVGAGLFAGDFAKSERVALSDRIAQQVLMAFSLALMVGAVFETGSRGGFNAMVISSLVTAFLLAGNLGQGRTRALARAGVVLAGVTYGLFLHMRPKWLGFAVGGGLDPSSAIRVSIYRSSLRLLGDFPLFGVGLGGFADAFRPYKERFIIDIVDHAHSSWLEIAVETGVFVAAAFFTASLSRLACLGRRISTAGLPARSLRAGWFAAFLGFAVHGCVEFSFQIPAGAVLFVAILAAADAPSYEPFQPVVPLPWRGALAALLFGLALVSLPPGFPGGNPRIGAPFGPLPPPTDGAP